MNRFSAGSIFRWQSTFYRIERLLPDGKANLEDTLSGAVQSVAIPVLVEAFFRAELYFVRKAGSPAEGSPTSPPGTGLPLSDYPAHLVAIARYRLEIIRPLLDTQERTAQVVRARCQEVKAAQEPASGAALQNAVSISAVYRWMQAYTQSGQDVRALIPSVRARGGKEKSRLRSEVETLAEMVIQEKCSAREQVTIDDVRNELAVRLEEENRVRPASEQLPLPSRATLARRIQGSGLKPGRAGTPNKDRQYQQTPYPGIPLERVEIDHTRSDLVVIDDRDNLPLGRMTLTYSLDTATRYPLGYYLGFEPPSYLTVMECLHHTICPKPEVKTRYGTEHDWLAYGVPVSLVIDNGKEFIGHDLEDACLLLGTVLQYTPVQTPQFKAGIERMFGSLNTMFFHTLPGTTFSNPTERGSYNSAEQACVYLSEVDKMLHLFLLDVYAERFHSGLEGIPARVWERKDAAGICPSAASPGRRTQYSAGEKRHTHPPTLWDRFSVLTL